MTRLFAAALSIVLTAPVALAQSDMSRTPSGSSDTETGPTRQGTPTTSDGSAAGVANDLGVDTSGCQEYLVPAHRDIVELRYLAEALPAGTLKREVAGRLDKLEADTASALGSVCGVRNLDRTPPRTFDALDIASVAGGVGMVFGNNIEINEDGFAVKVAEAAAELLNTEGMSRRERREAERSRARTASGTAAGDDVVAQIIAEIKAAPFADDKMAALQSGAAGKTFTSAQVAELVAAMPFAEQRIPVALALYGQTTDKANFEQEVSAALPFASERSQLRQALAAQ